MGLWVTANHRMTHGLQFQASYTLSKSTDSNSYEGAPGANNNGSLQDSTNLADSEALSDFDVRHRVSINASYDLPFTGNRWKDGWQVVVVEQAQSGNPLNVITNITTITGVASVRPDLIGALPAITPTPNLDANGQVISYQWFASNTVCDPRIAGSCTSASVFALPYNAAGVAHFGNFPRNSIVGPGFGDTDLSLIKNVKMAGSARVQLRVVGLQPVQPGEPRPAGPDGLRRQHVVRRDQQYAASRPATPDRRARFSSQRNSCSERTSTGSAAFAAADPISAIRKHGAHLPVYHFRHGRQEVFRCNSIIRP